MNSDRYPATLSFHSAGRLAHSLAEWKAEVDQAVASGSEDASYRDIVYITIATEARHLSHWYRTTEDGAEQIESIAILIESVS